jgi:hypothetical protein
MCGFYFPGFLIYAQLFSRNKYKDILRVFGNKSRYNTITDIGYTSYSTSSLYVEEAKKFDI